MSLLSRREAALVFLVFAGTYFISTLIRAITATLSPLLVQEFALSARDLGLLAGGYFLGFVVTQLPLGRWLDRYGPKRVVLCFLVIAVVGCFAFAQAQSFTHLLLARILCGVGVSACLMAPLTAYRRWFSGPIQQRASSWMLMSGSLGLVASTLPVQWLLQQMDWRALFVGLAFLIGLAMLLIFSLVPDWAAERGDTEEIASSGSYREVWRHNYFRKVAPLGFFNYGGLLAIQTLWAIPWMVQVADYSAVQAATGLFWINVGMLIAFWLWGLLSPWLLDQGWNADRLIQYGVPLNFILLAANIGASFAQPTWAAYFLALYCVSCTVITLAQPAVGMAFPSALAGRALSAYNLVIFAGVFAMQWGIGLLIDGLVALGCNKLQAFQGALALFLLVSMASYAKFLLAKSHNQAQDSHD